MIENRDEQEENTLFPIEVTLFGSVIDVRDEHEENALFPIEVTLFGNVIDVVLFSELSRCGRAVWEVLDTIRTLKEKTI